MKTICKKTKKEWRAWLRKNHSKENNVALICYKKHTGKPFLTHNEAMLEAICFGWIDTTIKKLDEDRFVRYFCRRTPKGKWSKNTQRYARELIKKKRMAKDGLEAFKWGLKFTPHDQEIPKNPIMPKGLTIELSKNKTAKSNFDAFAPSYKKMIYTWLISAKKEETKTKRIKTIVKTAKEKKKIY